ncbi:MAG: hypothetical protein R6U88_04275 [Candidatus Bipolaricaulota bacterium]
MRTASPWKKGMAALSALLIVGSVAAFGSGEVEVEEWYNPQSVGDLVAAVREMDWSWTQFEGDVEKDTLAVSYRLVGPEVVAGEDTTLVELVMDGETARVWLAEDDSIAQLEMGGELVPLAWMPAEQIEMMMTAYFWPFMMVEAFPVEEVATGVYQGVSIDSVDTEVREIGDLEVPVHRFEVSVSGEPHLEPGERVDYVWAIGDFGTFQMVVEWQWAGGDTGEEIAFNIQVERVVLR